MKKDNSEKEQSGKGQFWKIKMKKYDSDKDTSKKCQK